MTRSQPIKSTQGTNRTPSAPRPPNPQEQQVSIAIARSVKDYEALHAVKKVDKHLTDEDIEKLVEGEDFDANKLTDNMINSQEDPDIRIDPGSHKKGKARLEIKDTPITTPTIFTRIITDSLSLDKEKL
ncbi:hypothetical protein Tco_1445829 [Tanacetum coccineum]